MRLYVVFAMLVAGCGRIGFESWGVAAGAAGSDAGGGAGAIAGSGGGPAGGRGGSPAGGAGGSGAAGGSGGTGGIGGAAGSGGSNAGGGGAGGGGAGGGGAGGGALDAGSGGASGSGGALGDGGFVCDPAAPEICDGRDNDCSGAVDEAGCPVGCVGRAFGSHGYMLCNRTYTWDAAKAECEGEGLSLARIDSQAEQDFVYAFAFASRSSEVWIGGSDAAAEGDWRWPDGAAFWSGGASPTGSAVGGAFTQWRTPSEPDNLDTSMSTSGNCLALFDTQGGAWVDEGCNYFFRALCRSQ